MLQVPTLVMLVLNTFFLIRVILVGLFLSQSNPIRSIPDCDKQFEAKSRDGRPPGPEALESGKGGAFKWTNVPLLSFSLAVLILSVSQSVHA